MACASISGEHVEGIARLVVSETDGWCSLSGFGQVGSEFGSGDPKLYKITAPTICRHGIRKGGNFLAESTIFAFYEASYMVPQYASLNEGVWNSPTIKGPIIFACHAWDTNYQHFLIESFSRIWAMTNLSELESLRIVVSDEPHIRDILGVCFPNREFIYMRQGESLAIDGDIFFLGAVSRNFSSIPDILVSALLHLRTSVLSRFGSFAEIPSGERVVYFGRQPDPTYVGSRRVPIEMDKLKEILDLRGIVFRDFDGKNVVEKAGELRDVSVAITPVGANVMNMIFAKPGVRILVIEHPACFGGPYFRNLLQRLDICRHDGDVVSFGGTYLEPDEADRMSAPYHIHFDHLGKLIDEVCAAGE